MADTKTGKGLAVPTNPALALRQLNALHAGRPDEDNLTDQPTNQQTNNNTDKQPTKQTNNTTNKDTGGTEASGAGQDKESTLAESERVAGRTSASPPAVPPTKSKPANKPQNKQAVKQTNNTTKIIAPVEQAPPARRDGRTLRMRQPTAHPDATIVTSFRLSAATMEDLDEFCFRHRLRKQDVVQQALDAFIAAYDADGDQD